MRTALLFALAACATPPTCPPPSPPAAVAALGESFTIASRVLGERRVVNVYLPPGYGAGSARYPVLVMPDGGMAEDFPHVVGSVDVSIKNGVIRPLIVVGVQNTERRRDLVGPTVVAEEQTAAPHAGGNAKFRAFLRDELKPQIAARYRTTGESALIGESLAGLFVVETLLLEPTLFDGYIAADPSVWWNQAELVRHASADLAWWSAGPKQLYIATSDEAPLETTEELLTALRIAGAPVSVTYEPMPAEHHDSIFPTAALHGVRALFPDPERGN